LDHLFDEFRSPLGVSAFGKLASSVLLEGSIIRSVLLFRHQSNRGISMDIKIDDLF
jgi:hypothetical protein